MKLTYDKCKDLYKIYSGILVEAITSNDIELIKHYTDKICELGEYVWFEYDMDLTDTDLSDVL